jgi:hypothetical protein
VNHFVIALIVFVSVFGSAMLGLLLRSVLPERHLSDESSSTAKLAAGLIATMAALVLGLLVSSAKNVYDTANGDIVHNAAGVITIDRTLAEYGAETKELRALLKRNYTHSVDLLASGDPSQIASLSGPEAVGRTEGFLRKLRELAPRDDTQRELKVRVLQYVDEVITSHWLGLLQEHGSIPIALLVALVAWLCVIFGIFGLFAPLNGTTVGALALCALSAAGAIFLIEEMNSPLEGTIKVSFAPMREAIARLGE